MNGSKILSTLVVLLMVLSVVVVLNKVNIMEQAGASVPKRFIPGVNHWGNATTNLVYNPTPWVTVTMSTTGLTGGTDYYLYKPSYNNSGSGQTPATQAQWWTQVRGENGPSVYLRVPATPGGDVELSDSIKLDRAGMWIFATELQTIDGMDNTSFQSFFWVNTSEGAYEITPPATSIKYGDSGKATIKVTESDQPVSCYIDLIDPDGVTVFHKLVSAATGTYEFGIKHNISMAGDYTIRAYKDLDWEPNSQDYMYLYMDETETGTYDDWNTAGGFNGYDNTYGRFFSSGLNTTLHTAGDHWNYTICGPWDPPEKNATEVTFTVDTAEPTMVLTNTTVYWGFKTRIDINVTDSSRAGITGGTIRLKKSSNNQYLDSGDLTYTTFTTIGHGNYSIEMPRITPGDNKDWGTLENGTWYVYFTIDSNGDGTDEWNSSSTTQNKFIVKGTTPPVQLVINNDGSGTNRLDKKVNVPDYDHAGHPGETPVVSIDFSIYGTSISDAEGRAYYGDDTGEDWKNMTVTGDILYPPDGNTLVHSNNGNWNLSVTPTKPGGTIIVTIDWPGDDNGSASQTINIINGSSVVPTIESFSYGVDTTLTFSVKDIEGDLVKTALTYLMWEEDDDEFNDTAGDSTTGNGKNGEYSRLIIPDDYHDANAPKNVTIAVMDKQYNNWGYARVRMDRNHNMMVNVTPTSAYAGNATTYDIMVSLLAGGNPEKTGLDVQIFDVNGDEVTDSSIVSGTWPKSGDYEFDSEEIILAGGTYYLYAHNSSHDSTGHNATITITKYNVNCNPSVLAWLIDTETNITFEVTPHTEGTLYLLNMSSTPNASDVGNEKDVDIEGGFGTLDTVDATNLGNVTFEFMPSGGDRRPADGLLRITTATATPSPAAIYLGEPTTVTITVTHPATGNPIKDVRVGLDHDINASDSVLAKMPDDAFTDANGQVSFAITAEASGDITIYIENGTDPDNAFVITAAARKTLTLTNDPSVDELGAFTVQAKSNGVLITDATVTVVFNGETKTTTTGTITLTAPSVRESTNYPIAVSANGYTSASGTIMVLNVPQLIISAPTTVGASSAFTVTVADDTGSAIIGATVTMGTTTATTGAGGTASLTAPATKGNVQITATFGTYKSASATVSVTEKGIPGFELVTLIAALGVAFILLRRRQK